MTIASGNSVQALDYNAIQSAINGLLGTGTSGYYQTVTSAQVTKGSTFKNASLTALRADINKCRKHQTGSNFTTTELPAPVAGQLIRGAEIAKYQTCVNAVLASPLTAAAANMTLTATSITVTRATAWGTNATPSITSEVQINFSNVTSKNAFFNTGGEIRWALTHGPTTTPQDASWTTLLSGLGAFNIHGGSAKTLTATSVLFPLDLLTTTYQTIFTASSATASYTSNTITINAKMNAGLTGVVVQIILNDAHTNATSDSVALGTKVVFSQLKSTVTMTGISTPTYTALTSF